MKLKVGILVSPCPSVSALFSMLFSALWLGCGELGMRKYSPRYGWNAEIMRRFLRIPVRILPSAFSPHFFPYRNAEKYAEISPRSCPNTPIRIFSAFFAIQECGDFSAFLSEYSHPHFLRKENAEIWGTGLSRTDTREQNHATWKGRFTVGKLVRQGWNPDGTNQSCPDGNSIRLAANTKNTHTSHSFTGTLISMVITIPKGQNWPQVKIYEASFSVWGPCT